MVHRYFQYFFDCVGVYCLIVISLNMWVAQFHLWEWHTTLMEHFICKTKNKLTSCHEKRKNNIQYMFLLYFCPLLRKGETIQLYSFSDTFSKPTLISSLNFLVLPIWSSRVWIKNITSKNMTESEAMCVHILYMTESDMIIALGLSVWWDDMTMVTPTHRANTPQTQTLMVDEITSVCGVVCESACISTLWWVLIGLWRVFPIHQLVLFHSGPHRNDCVNGTTINDSHSCC